MLKTIIDVASEISSKLARKLLRSKPRDGGVELFLVSTTSMMVVGLVRRLLPRYSSKVMKYRIYRHHLTVSFTVDLSASRIVVTSSIKALNLVLGVLSLFLCHKHSHFRSGDLRTARFCKAFLREIANWKHAMATGGLRQVNLLARR